MLKLRREVENVFLIFFLITKLISKCYYNGKLYLKDILSPYY